MPSPLASSARALRRASLGGALAAAVLLGLTAGCAAAGERAMVPQPERKEAPADPALLARLPLVVEAVVNDDPGLAGQSERLRATLRRLAAAEGFTVAPAEPKGAPKGAWIALQTSVQWAPPTGLADQHLFVALVLDQDGERVDEVALQQTEGFPAEAAELDKLLTPLVRKLARSPRLRERILSLQ